MANKRNENDITKFAQDLYDVLGMNTNDCTQEQFFDKYVENDNAFIVVPYADEAIIHFDDFTITIRPNK